MDLLFLIFIVGPENERASAEEMDEKRLQNVAYQYLCHLEEAKVYGFFPFVRWCDICCRLLRCYLF